MPFGLVELDLKLVVVGSNLVPGRLKLLFLFFHVTNHLDLVGLHSCAAYAGTVRKVSDRIVLSCGHKYVLVSCGWGFWGFVGRIALASSSSVHF